MKATELLSAEHRVIERVLLCLERIAGAAVGSGKLDVEGAGDVIRFLRSFADGVHHVKEEELLFPAMQQKGLPIDAGPIAVMLNEHELGREGIRALERALEHYREGDERAVAEFHRQAMGYSSLLRDHIVKEDGILFPMADALLDADGQAQLVEQFRSAEDVREESESVEALTGLADRLAERLGITGQQERPSFHPCAQHFARPELT